MGAANVRKGVMKSTPCRQDKNGSKSLRQQRAHWADSCTCLAHVCSARILPASKFVLSKQPTDVMTALYSLTMTDALAAGSAWQHVPTRQDLSTGENLLLLQQIFASSNILRNFQYLTEEGPWRSACSAPTVSRWGDFQHALRHAQRWA